MIAAASSPTLTEHQWATSDASLSARLFCLKNDRIEVWLTDLGASIYRIRTPDSQGNWADIACAPRRLEAFSNHPAFMGATIGRYANRIAEARFTLQGETYHLTANDGGNTLHGGECWHRDHWQASTEQTKSALTVEFTRHSPDGEGGFPGNVDARVTYRLGNDGCLHLTFSATTDVTTVLNMTNHTYFNLNGADYQNLEGHHVRLPATHVTAVTADAIPTGALQPVVDTPFDFKQSTDLAARLAEHPAEFSDAGGIDHNYVYKLSNAHDSVLMTEIVNVRNGRTLTLHSTQPGMQFYTGNYMAGLEGPDRNRTYQAQQGFCIEPQHFPDTPNQPRFPSCVVTPEQPYRESVVMTFGVTAPAD